jgi:UDP-N-acetylglucosamine/UDP-N-acetylgalactosamine 4-epimerase
VNDSILEKRILITGGAGFIGSNIVDYLMSIGHTNITVLDNLETGSLSNLNPHLEKIKCITGDITNYDTCLNATQNCDVVLHQAALGSVPRSIANPTNTHATNLSGFLNMLEACKTNKVKRFVYASSSSVYGSDETLPKQEHKTGQPLSPYAITKVANELYANVFYKLYNLEVIGLRYFNVFGAKQNPAGPYAAVIPIFINNCLNNEPSFIFGDGTNQRDFTHVSNVVQANILAATTNNDKAFGDVFNIAFGGSIAINELYELIKTKLNSDLQIQYKAPRIGEIKNSFAAIDKAKEILGYQPQTNLQDGINITVNWYQAQQKK